MLEDLARVAGAVALRNQGRRVTMTVHRADDGRRVLLNARDVVFYEGTAGQPCTVAYTVDGFPVELAVRESWERLRTLVSGAE